MDGIFQLESSSGKNDKCVRKGLGFNGYGYGQSLTKNNCYKSYAEVRQIVYFWLSDKRAEGLSDAEILCYYNLGTPGLSGKCEYYEKFLEIK